MQSAGFNPAPGSAYFVDIGKRFNALQQHAATPANKTAPEKIPAWAADLAPPGRKRRLRWGGSREPTKGNEG